MPKIQNLKEAVKKGQMPAKEALRIMRKRSTWAQAQYSRTANWLRERARVEQS